MSPQTTPPTEPPTNFYVPVKLVLAMSAPWVVALLAMLLAPRLGVACVPYAVYLSVRSAGLMLLLALVVAGLLTAWKYVGGDKVAAPWYTNAFLVATVIFWALFPPTWFFTEYYLFDNDVVAIGNALKQMPCPPDIQSKKDFLLLTKTYADLAFRVWAAVGTTLGGVIAIARR